MFPLEFVKDNRVMPGRYESGKLKEQTFRIISQFIIPLEITWSIDDFLTSNTEIESQILQSYSTIRRLTIRALRARARARLRPAKRPHGCISLRICHGKW